MLDKGYFRANLHFTKAWLRKPEISQLKSRKGEDREAWWLRDAFFWGPLEQYAQFSPPGTPPCLRAGCAGHIASSESLARRGARFVHTMEDGYYLYRVRYICSNKRTGCRAEILSDAPRMMELYPECVRERSPALGTSFTLYSKDLAPLLRRYMGTPGNNATSFQNTISECRADYWYRRGLLYNLNFAFERARRSGSIAEKGYEGPPGLWPEPAYVPSRYFWREQYLADFANRKADLVSELQTTRCRSIIRVDHTGPAARKMGSVGGKWVANVMNEDNEIAAYALVASDAREHLREIVVGVRRRHAANNEPLADVVYVGKNRCSKGELKFWGDV